MPRVPQLPEQRVGLAPLPTGPGPSRPPVAPGLGVQPLLQAAGGLAQEQAEIVRREQDRAHAIRVKEEDTALRGAFDRISLEVQGFRGRQALDSDLVAEADGRLDSFLQDRDREASDRGEHRVPRTDEAVRLMRESMRQELRGVALSHAQRESLGYEQEVHSSHLKSLFQSARQHRDDPGYVDETILAGLESINAFADSTGKSPGWLEVAGREFQSRMHVQVLEGILADGQDRAAKEYFDARKDELTAQDLATMSARIQDGTYLGEALRITDGLMARDPDLGEAMGQVAKIQDPRLRKETEREVKNALANKEFAQRVQEEALLDQYLRGIKLHKGELDIRDLRLDANWHKLPVKSQQVAENYFKAANEQSAIETDWQRYSELITMEPDQFLRVNLLQDRNSLSDSHLKQLLDLQAKMKGDEADQALDRLRAFRSDEKIINDLLLTNGFDPGSKSKGDRKRLAELRLEIDSRKRQEQAEKKQDRLSPEELGQIVQQVLSAEMLKATGPGFFGRLGIFFPGQAEALAIERVIAGFEAERVKLIPEANRQEMTRLLQSGQRKVTEEKLRRLYEAELADDLPLFERILLEAP